MNDIDEEAFSNEFFNNFLNNEGDNNKLQSLLVPNENILFNKKVSTNENYDPFTPMNISESCFLAITNYRIFQAMQISKSDDIHYVCIGTFKNNDFGDNISVKTNKYKLYIKVNNTEYIYSTFDTSEIIKVFNNRKSLNSLKSTNSKTNETVCNKEDKRKDSIPDYIIIENENKAKKLVVLGAIGSILCILVGVLLFYKDNSSSIILVIIGLLIGKVTITSYNSRCPECGKLRAMITIDSNVISRSNYTTTKKVNMYDNNNKVIGKVDQYVQGERIHTNDTDKCKYCNYTRNIRRYKDIE